MARNYPVRLALDPKSWKAFEKKLVNMEKAVRKQVQDAALQAGGKVLLDAETSMAPGPNIVMEVLSGRTLKKRRKSAGVKGNSRVVAVGPDEKHWYYKYAESGTTAHDVSVGDPGLIKIYESGAIRAWARRAGGIRKYAFVARAVDGYGDRAIAEMGRVLGEEITKAFSG